MNARSCRRSFGPSVGRRYEPVGGLVPQGISAEMIADKWNLSREDLDAFGAQSQERAQVATAEGRFETAFVEHAYIEPEAGFAVPIGNGPDRVEVTAGRSTEFSDDVSAWASRGLPEPVLLNSTSRARIALAKIFRDSR